ncbi:glycine N-acyltransferase-like protein 3 [Gigantopelta aegis]|uniref:glycine N-acyltransferase-like protein 3 n=1 Tax=Gigantopelta aegis TaxID=1735272 RepID=UPI001B88E029|nr:glycine N-acyltransferase-like protein 3 [Gigantopelta aegis]XP_041354434.1 glycine N-acyltransferase-like protein 3 [Gigantopelta aegis]
MAVVLDKTQLPELLDGLEKSLPRSLKVHGDLKALLSGQWPGIDFVVDRWPDFSVVITKYDPTKTKCQYINHWCSIFCQDENAFKMLLEQPIAVDWSRRIMFDAVDLPLLDILKETIKRIGSRICFEASTQMLQVTADSLVVVPVPEHLNMKSLESRNEVVETIAANWPYSEPGVEEFIRQMIDTFPSRCLVDKEDNLIGYAIGESWMLGMLFVKPEYRGRGYGKVIMSQLASVYVRSGDSPVVCIVLDNPVSIKMHEQIGFKVIPGVTPSWMRSEPVN